MLGIADQVQFQQFFSPTNIKSTSLTFHKHNQLPIPEELNEMQVLHKQIYYNTI